MFDPAASFALNRRAFLGRTAGALGPLALAHLLDPGTRGEEIWPMRGVDVRVPFYRVGHHKVWGATAMVLCELLTLIQEANR